MLFFSRFSWTPLSRLKTTREREKRERSRQERARGRTKSAYTVERTPFGAYLSGSSAGSTSATTSTTTATMYSPATRWNATRVKTRKTRRRRRGGRRRRRLFAPVLLSASSFPRRVLMMMMIAGLFVFFWGRDGGNDGVNGSSFSLLRANAMKFMTTYHNETIMVARNARKITF